MSLTWPIRLSAPSMDESAPSCREPARPHPPTGFVNKDDKPRATPQRACVAASKWARLRARSHSEKRIAPRLADVLSDHLSNTTRRASPARREAHRENAEGGKKKKREDEEHRLYDEP